MKRIKMMLMAMVAVMAVGAVGATAAQAANTGHIETNLGNCDVTFSRGAKQIPDSHYPTWEYGADLFNFAKDTSAGKSCAANAFSATLHFHKNSDGTAQVIGNLEIETDYGTCEYSGTINGHWTWGDSPANTYKHFTVDNDTSVDLVGGDFLCYLIGDATVLDTSTLDIDWS